MLNILRRLKTRYTQLIETYRRIIYINKETSTQSKQIKQIDQKFSQKHDELGLVINTIQSNQSLINNQLSAINYHHFDVLKILTAKTVLANQKVIRSKKLTDFEFKVFSQWGDDGIIQFLINNTKIKSHTFIEFGVEDYFESNTRFLLMNNNWSGYIIDGSKTSVKTIKRQNYYWRHDIRATRAWITRKNINSLLKKTGWKDIGLLSIDIDGNDYWIWNDINTSQLNPTIVIIEYNSVFGADKSITVPYKSKFNRTSEHFSNLFFGASLKALVELSKNKGYCFVGCNSNGNNAYFVRKDCLGRLKEVKVGQGYVKSKFRESRSYSGKLSFLRNDKRQKLISGLPVYNTKTKTIEPFHP